MTWETENFKVTYIGLSNDLRTNKWSVTSKCCNKTYEPPTTILPSQLLVCPKCGIKELINYNNLK